jgi:hypothetical protein
MKAATSSFVVSESTLVAIPEISGIFSWIVGTTGTIAPAGPEAGGTTRNRRTVARIPIMHPRARRMPSFFVSREYHHPPIFPINRFIVFVFIFKKNVRSELYPAHLIVSPSRKFPDTLLPKKFPCRILAAGHGILESMFKNEGAPDRLPLPLSPARGPDRGEGCYLRGATETFATYHALPDPCPFTSPGFASPA